MNSEMTDFARGLKCGGFGVSGELATGPELAGQPAASRLSCVSRSIRARPPMPMPASIQNFRREMYFPPRLRSLGLSLMFMIGAALLQIHKLVEIRNHVGEVAERGQLSGFFA